MPTEAEVLAMLARMHGTAADSEAAAGRHASSADLDQKAAKYRDAANKSRAEEEQD